MRSELWFNNPADPAMTALYLERYLNYGFTREELQSGRPIIGIAQSGSDLSPCNRVHLDLAKRVRDGIVQAGGIPLEFPTHPIQETGRRPTAALDRNLAYLGLVEILHGYPIDGVVLTTGCDKTTPSALMAVASVNLPAIVLTGGPMLDGYYKGQLAGSGMAIWQSRLDLAEGKIDYKEFMDIVASSATSVGYCNTMGTASTMNSLAEALGMSLPGCAAIPAPYKERGEMAFLTGKKIVDLVQKDIKPENILTKEAFENAIVVNSALGGSTNAQPHITAIARHVGIDLPIGLWEEKGYAIPLLVNMQPAGKYLSEAFYHAGGVPAVMNELAKQGKLNLNCLTVNGETVGENIKDKPILDFEVIASYDKPLREKAGFKILRGNLFDSAIIKTSVISEEFYQRFFNRKNHPRDVLVGKAVVFDGIEEYHQKIDDPSSEVDENSILIIRNAGPVGWPGSAEVVNMRPPEKLVKKGIKYLPCLGDGRQSGTSPSPSILHATPESCLGGGLAYVKNGDRIKIDLNDSSANVLVSEAEWEKRKRETKLKLSENQTPWQEIYRNTVGQLETGACLELSLKYHNIKDKIPKNSH